MASLLERAREVLALALLFSLGWLSFPAQAQPAPAWIPAPAPVPCATVTNIPLRGVKTEPSPIIVGEPYALTIDLGSPLHEYYFDVVGTELRFFTRQSSVPVGFENYCYRLTSPPILFDVTVTSLARTTFERQNENPPVYRTIPGVTIFYPLVVAAAAKPAPSLGTFALFFLSTLVLFSVRRKLLTISSLLVCYVIAPPYGGFISDAEAQGIRDVKVEAAAAQKASREVAILLRKDAPGLSVAALARAINDEKGDARLKAVLPPGARNARALLHRTPTAFEVVLHERFPDEPLAKLFRYVVVEYDDKSGRDSAVGLLQRDTKNFEAIHANFPVDFAAAPSESFFGNGTNVQTQWGMNKLNFPAAWDKTRGRAFIAPIDNGIETDHPDLIKNFRTHLSTNIFTPQYFDDPDEMLVPSNGIYFGHGTHVASIMASSHNDGGTAGGCPQCSLVVIRQSSDANGFAIAVVRSVDTGVQVLNMSFETLPSQNFNCLTTDQSAPLCLALTHAKNSAVTVVAAAGNNGNYSVYSTGATQHTELWPLPAVHPDVLAVSGLQFNGTSMSFWTGAPGSGATSGYAGSNFGTIVNGVPQISFAAPAVNIVASVFRNETWNANCGDSANPSFTDANGVVQTSTPSDGIGFCTGTSMAAPHIAAMAGLVKSANPLLDTAGVKSVLIQSATCLETGIDRPCTATSTLAGVAGDAMKKLGYGVPKADNAVKIALGSETAKNRLTPLFGSFQVDISTGVTKGHTHFYTTNPQMMLAALRGTESPRVSRRLLNLSKWSLNRPGFQGGS